MKKAYIIHGWSGKPDSNWFPWLRKELENNNFEVFMPQMPDTDTPTIEKWVGHLEKIIKNPDEDTHLVGHSMGCQAIMRYLEKLGDAKIGGAILVAGFFTLTNLDSVEEKNIAKPWVNTPIDFERVINSCKKLIAIFSDNDPWVPKENFNLFKKNINADVIVINNAGHFNESDGFTQFPIVLEKLLEI